MTNSGKSPTASSPPQLQSVWVGFALLCMLLLAVGAVSTALGAWEIISL